MSNSCDPMNFSLPGSSVHRIVQPRVLEWVAISFSRDACMYVCIFFWYCAATFKHSLFFFHLYSPFESVLSMNLLAESSVHPHKCIEEARSCFKLRTIRHTHATLSPRALTWKSDSEAGEEVAVGEEMAWNPTVPMTWLQLLKNSVSSRSVSSLSPFAFRWARVYFSLLRVFALWIRDQNYVSIYLMKEITYAT